MNELDLFTSALALSDPAERGAYLDRACADNPDLRRRLDELLSAHARSGNPLDSESVGTTATGDPVPAGATATFGTDAPAPTADFPGKDDRAGAVIDGKYTLVEPIGEGGMGAVWRAKQTEPVKRFVAVKLIKAGMDSKQVLARFEAERQALAMMDHPNIARVLDGGLHDARPFFVMELVKGVPITDYCDKCKLTPTERLELFVPVCQAIQHAHQKGIIHRDIKPSNVLIALFDDKPVPKVIDFGVAKATGAALTEHTIDTGFGGVVGTPQYMSPEQATFNNLDIDTRSDVYSLGVLLYELLAGSPPFSKKELEKRGLLEILRVVREEEPPKPSIKLSTADALPSLSANRGTEPKKLTGLLRNELDWIVMKALEKDRARRYETANGFAADVLRYLSGEVVVAHPPSAGYRLRKFVRRHRPQVVAAGLVLLALVAGVIGTTFGLIEARKQERLALVAAEEERQAKLREAERADDEQRAKLTAEAKEREANVERAKVIAAHQRNAELIVRLEKAKEEDDRDWKLAVNWNEILGSSVFAGLAPKANHATVGEFREAWKKSLRMAAVELDGSGSDDPLRVAQMQNTLASSLIGLGKYEQAIAVFEKSLATCKVEFGPDNPLTLTTMNYLAQSYWAAGKLDKALPLYEETLQLRKPRLGADHPHTLATMNGLALCYWAAGQLDKALPLFEEAYKLQKAKFGPDHPHTLTTLNNLAHGYWVAGKLDNALPLFEEAYKSTKAKPGPDLHNTLRGVCNLAQGYWVAGKLDKALPLFEEAFKFTKAKFGPVHPDTLISMGNLARGYQAAGKPDLALPLYEETLRRMKSVFGPDDPLTLTTMNELGTMYGEAHQGEKASATLREFVAGSRKQFGKGGPPFAKLLAEVSLCLLGCEQWAAAEEMLRECLAILEKARPDAWTTFSTQSMLGGALLGQKKYADAEPLLLKGYEGMKVREESIPPQAGARLPEALDRLAELYTATDKPDEAAKWRAERAKYPNLAPPPRERK